MNSKEKDKKVLKATGSVLLTIIRILLFILVLIPLYLVLVSVLGGIIFYICLLIDGLPYLSPLLGLLSALAFILFFTYLLTKLVIDGNVKVGVLLFHFSSCLALLVATSCLVPFEILKTELVDDIPDNYKNVDTVYKVSNKAILNTNNYYVKYVVDKKAKKEYRIVVSEPESSSEKFEVMVNKNRADLIKTYHSDYENFRKLVMTVYDNLKDKKVYKYNRLFDKEVTIYANSKTIDKIKKANQHQ